MSIVLDPFSPTVRKKIAETEVILNNKEAAGLCDPLRTRGKEVS